MGLFYEKNQMDLSDELLVYRFGQGIKLLRPNHQSRQKQISLGRSTQHTVGSMLKVPMCCYFDDLDITIQRTNEHNAEACGYDSAKEGVGKTLFDIFDDSAANLIFNKDKEMLQANRMHFAEETALCKDDIQYQALSVKFPWYGDDNCIIGMMGFSIVLGKQPLAESLAQITQLGLLNNTSSSILPGLEIDNQYLSKRESECLRLTVRGKSAKQIAIELEISRRTVEEYLNNIKLKLGVFSKSELIDKVFDTFYG